MTALVAAMKGAQYRVYEGLVSTTRDRSRDVPSSLYDLPIISTVTYTTPGAQGMREVVGTLFVGIGRSLPPPLPLPAAARRRASDRIRTRWSCTAKELPLTR